MVKSSPQQTESPKRLEFEAKNIAQLAERFEVRGYPEHKTKSLPPVELWNPDFCGDMDMEIRADGSWFHEGAAITRKEMVQLFAGILRKDEDGKTYLVTPVEKLGIKVEDAHFIVVDMHLTQIDGMQILEFRTNLDDYVKADENHPLRFENDPETGGLKPYIKVRGRLEAVFSRALVYDLVALGEEACVEGRQMFVIRSQGQIFPVMDMDKLSALTE
jgi:hypothetical protein